MKIKVNDLEYLLKQIRELVNPTTKEHNKILNTLKIFLEDNTDVQDPAILSIKQEILQRKFYDLSKTRREAPKELSKEFKDFCVDLKKKIESFPINQRVEKIEYEYTPIDCKAVFEDIKKINKESEVVCERMDVFTGGLNTKSTSNSDKTIINYFKTL